MPPRWLCQQCGTALPIRAPCLRPPGSPSPSAPAGSRTCWSRKPETQPSVSSVNLDLAGFGQHVDDVCLEVSVVHPRLPELPGVAVVLPVVVPVPPAVSTEPKDVHLP